MDSELNPVIPSALHHFAITTGRLEEMKDWYGIALGMVPVVETAGLAGAAKTCWLTYGDANFRIVLTSVDGIAPPAERKPAAHLRRIAFEFPNMDDLLNSYARLNSLGVIPVYAADHGAVTSFYYEDPDGNVLELTVNNYPSPAECVKFLNTAEYAANPMGTPVEPDRMVIQRSEGMSIEELHQRAYAGEFPPYKPGNPEVLL
jgi:catechol 2,3-dioxygenase-like lactoylglutathione lyase family enzyme